jgi:tRNA(Arg) A34 adenosine deaminase TadA
MTATSQRFLRQAIELALEAVRSGRGGPFGAVVVLGGEVVGRGINEVTSALDPTAHAEIVAIRAACRALGTFQLAGAEVYASCEPCPMCLGAIYWARAARVYFAASREDAAASGFDDGFIAAELALPAAARRIPMAQDLREEALAVFRLWDEKPDRTRY